MLSNEQITQVKKQLVQQIDTNFPEDKKEFARQQIVSMNNKQLEEFLKQNNLIATQQTSQNQQSIFRSIVNEQAPSYKIDENKGAIAVLEINPISQGHILIIPKEPVASIEKIPQTVFALAKKIAKKIKTKFKPKDISISSLNALGELIINILPIYKNETINSQRRQANKEELEKLQEHLKKKSQKRTVKKRIKTEKPKEKLWLPKRIP